MKCRDWFRRFKNNAFEREDKEHFGSPKKFENKERKKDPCNTLDDLGKSLQIDGSAI